MAKFQVGDRVTIVGYAEEIDRPSVIQPTEDELGLTGTVVRVTEYVTSVPDYDIVLDKGNTTFLDEKYLERVS